MTPMTSSEFLAGPTGVDLHVLRFPLAPDSKNLVAGKRFNQGGVERRIQPNPLASEAQDRMDANNTPSLKYNLDLKALN